EEAARGEGWLARGLGEKGAGDSPFLGIALGERVMPRVLIHPSRQALCCDDLAELVPPEAARKVLTSDALSRLASRAGSPAARRLAAASRALLGILEGVLARPPSSDFPRTHAGRLFADAFRLVASDLQVPAIFVRQGGFDTHARQADSQPQLLA